MTKFFLVHHVQHHTHPIIVSEESPERLSDNVFYNPFSFVQITFLARFTFPDSPDDYSNKGNSLHKQPQRSCYIRGPNSQAPRQFGTAHPCFFFIHSY